MWLDVQGQAVSLPGIVVLGVIVGLVAGMFGIGGGFLLIPVLTLLFRVPLPIAIGTNLCQMVGTAVAAFLRHRKIRQGEIRVDLLMLAGSVLGVDAGTRALAALTAAGSTRVLGHGIPTVNLVGEGAYAVLMLGSAMAVWRQARTVGARVASVDPLDSVRRGPLARLKLGPSVDLPALPLRGVSAIGIAYLGLMLGFVSGLLGLGGGVALMPVLIYGFGFPIRQAAGTGILALLVSSMAGTYLHALSGHVHLGLSMTLLVGATTSAQLGATLTRRLPARTLRKVFALLLLAAVAALAWDLVRRLE